MFEVISKVRDQGGHVEIPKDAPSPFKKIMKGVFKQEPSERLSMSEIYQILEEE